MNNFKNLIIFTGTGRSIDYTFKNIKENIIESLSESDVIILLSDNPHVSKVQEYFSKLPQVKKIIVEEEAEQDISNVLFRPNWPNKNSSRQIYMKMINQRKRCNDIIDLYERENNIAYKRVVFSRLDVKYFDQLSPHINNLDNKYLYIPDFHNTFGGVIDGYNDRFVIANREDIKIYFNVPDSIGKYNRLGGQVSAESLLKWHLLTNGIIAKKIPYRFTRVRNNGEEIDNRLKKLNLQWSDT